jgi:hypothetical protein
LDEYAHKIGTHGSESFRDTGSRQGKFSLINALKISTDAFVTVTVNTATKKTYIKAWCQE